MDTETTNNVYDNDKLYDAEYIALTKVAPFAFSYMLLCDNADCTKIFSKNTTSWQKDESIDWLIHLTCKNCNVEWKVCCACRKFDLKLKNKRQINTHHNNHHKKNKNNAVINNSTNHKRLKTNNNNDTELRNDLSSNHVYLQKYCNNTNESETNNSTIQSLCDDAIELETNISETDLSVSDFQLESNASINDEIQADVVGKEANYPVDLLASKQIMDVVTITNNFVKKHNDMITNKNNVMEVLDNLLKTITNNVDKYNINKKTLLFYAHDMVSSGKKYVVSQMCADQVNNQQHLIKVISDVETNLQIMLSQFTYSLTRSQQKLFGELLFFINEVYVKKVVDPVCQIPANYNDLRKMYLDGNLAITKHLPLPDVTLQNEHSYVRISDCVADFLIRKDNILLELSEKDNVLRENKLDNDLSVFNCKRFNEIVNAGKQRINQSDLNNTLPMVPLFLCFWSDDFDPNKSTKTNRQSVWIKTLTIFTISHVGEKLKVTYPISLAMKGLDHEVVEQNFATELDMLRSGKLLTMYSRSHTSMVYVHADVFCVLNDQPKRRNNLKLGNGNSLLHGRFGYILDVRQKNNVVRSCSACSSSIISEALSCNQETSFRYEWRLKTCRNCTAWMYNWNSTLLHYYPDRDFPCDLFEEENNNGQLLPKRITKDTLEIGITSITNYLVSGEITPSQSRSDLKNLGLNCDAQDQIIQIAVNIKNYNDAYRLRFVNETLYNSVKNERQKFPSLYKQFQLPATWYGFQNLNVYVEVPMHLLMLGVVKAVMIKITTWLRLINMKAAYLNIVKGKFAKIKKLSVEWCKILEYPRTDKTGGWVSENFAAMARLMIWFYSNLNYLNIKQQYKDPITDYKTWNRIVCKKWLQVRGIKKRSGDVNELR